MTSAKSKKATPPAKPRMTLKMATRRWWAGLIDDQTFHGFLQEYMQANPAPQTAA